MSKKLSRLVSALLAVAMLFALCSCGSKTEEAAEEPVTETAPAETDAPVEGTEVEPEPEPEVIEQPTTLVVGYSEFSEKFSPFFSKTAYDQDAYAMTQVSLIGNDREGNLILDGINGETHAYNGVDYFYDGIATTVVTQNDDGTVDYDIQIRDDIVFSDGEPMNIDDVIFNMYVLSDPSYDGSSTFYALPIEGMTDYRSGVKSDIYDKYSVLGYAIYEAGQDNTDFSGWTEEQQTSFWTVCLEAGGEKFAQEIVNYCAENYASYLSIVGGSEVALGMYCWGFADVNDNGVLVTSTTGTEFDVANGVEPTLADYWAELCAAYENDLEELSSVESAASAVSDLVVESFISVEGPKDAEAGGTIDAISGIIRTGDYSVRIHMTEFSATAIYQLSISVAPLHYYGDVSLYDYENNSFGFPKGDLSIVKSVTTKPLGAGPYVFESYENGVITYHANELYFKGCPKTDFVLFQEGSDSDKLAGLVSGQFDITDPSFSTSTVDSIKEYNSNGELTGDVITTSTVDNLGYGYIGICATTMNVGGDIDSDASKNLRKAFATLFAVYRDTTIYSYYGDRASVIQYPISNTSWAAPRPADEGYRLAYSVGVDGADLYADGMTEEEKYDAALAAAVEYLKAAGFTWDEASETFTAAPEGCSLSFEAQIPADGIGDHPAYGILTAAKDALAKVGITLEIKDLANSADLWTALEAGQCEMWAAAWGATIDPDMYQVYHSSNIVGLPGSTESNHYGIQDEELDELIVAARQSADQSYRKATYKQCLDIILDWGVEVPTYQRQNAVIFSTERVNIDTVTPDITTFYGWMSEIENIEVN